MEIDVGDIGESGVIGVGTMRSSTIAALGAALTG